MNKQDIEQTIANVEQQLASLKAELLKQATPEPQKKWKRKGSIVLCEDGTIMDYAGTGVGPLIGEELQGRTYQTLESAKSVRPYDAFYGLLCGLACELNPSGKIGCKAKVWFDGDYWVPVGDFTSSWDTAMLFDNDKTALEAAAILNRDGIKPPQAGGAV
jgi:hypothetical protein